MTLTQVVPARRRRHSGVGHRDLSHLVSPDELDPPPRPKSSPVEPPLQRRRQNSPVHSSESEPEEDMQIDEDISKDGSDSSSGGITILKRATTTDRPTRPLPASKTKKIAAPTPLKGVPFVPNPNPLMLPVQRMCPKGVAAASQRPSFRRVGAGLFGGLPYLEWECKRRQTWQGGRGRCQVYLAQLRRPPGYPRQDGQGYCRC